MQLEEAQADAEHRLESEERKSQQQMQRLRDGHAEERDAWLAELAAAVKQQEAFQAASRDDSYQLRTLQKAHDRLQVHLYLLRIGIF